MGRLVDFVELHDAGKRERDWAEAHCDLALVGAVIDHVGQLGTGHAGRDAPDVHQHSPRFIDPQWHLE